jgi:hypothetical protein
MAGADAERMPGCSRQHAISGGSLFRSGQLKRVFTMATSTAVVSVTVLSAVPAHATEPVVSDPLDLPAVTAFAVDSAHGQLLFGSGTKQNGVLVTDLSGVTVTTLAASAGISDIAVSADGTVAYAAASAPLAKIYKIDLASLTVVDTYTLPAADCVSSLAVVSPTSVAFGFTCDSQFGGVGNLNPATRVVTSVSGPYYNPFVRAVPHTTRFISGSIGLSPAQAALWDVATGTPTSVISLNSLGTCESLEDLAVAPGGATFVAACGYPYYHAEYSTTDFSAVATYATNPYPTAAAFSPNGSLLAAGMNGLYQNDVALFHHTASNTSAVFSLDYTDSDTAEPTTPPHGLAFSADSSQLYSLAEDSSSSPATIWLVTLGTDGPPTFPPVSPPPPPVSPPPVSPPPAPPVMSTVTITAPQIIKVGQPVTFTGKLWFVDYAALAGKVVTLSAAVGGVTTTGQATVDATGSYRFSIYPSRVGTMVTTATFAGDVKHLSSHGGVVMSVIRATPKLTLSATKAHGKVYVVTAHLSAWYGSKSVKILAGKKVIAAGKVSAKGLLTVRYQRKVTTRLVAVYGGDATDVPAKVTLTLR